MEAKIDYKKKHRECNRETKRFLDTAFHRVKRSTSSRSLRLTFDCNLACLSRKVTGDRFLSKGSASDWTNFSRWHFKQTRFFSSRETAALAEATLDIIFQSFPPGNWKLSRGGGQRRTNSKFIQAFARAPLLANSIFKKSKMLKRIIE